MLLSVCLFAGKCLKNIVTKQVRYITLKKVIICLVFLCSYKELFLTSTALNVIKKKPGSVILFCSDRLFFFTPENIIVGSNIFLPDYFWKPPIKFS